MPISAKNIIKLGLECKNCRYCEIGSSGTFGLWCCWRNEPTGRVACAHWEQDLPEDKKVDIAPDSAILPEKEEQ